MYLIIDVGNSYLKASIYDLNQKLVRFNQIKNTEINKDFFIKLTKDLKITKAYIGLSKLSLFNNISNFIYDVCNIKLNQITNNDFLDEFDLSKFNVDEIGTDILGYALYLKKTFNKGIGICMGTVTFAVGVENNKIYGVTIFPINGNINQLTKLTEGIKFDQINQDKNYLDLGQNTNTSILSGLNHYQNGGLNSFINYCYKKYQFTKFCITGGKSKSETIKSDNKNIEIIYQDNAVIKGYMHLVFAKAK